ncbi:MAG: FtsX-like permease family protein [Lachnospiraceae bacterium]|nr:FtsX-like permease family protein [Lachnospiraceae bacterium]
MTKRSFFLKMVTLSLMRRRSRMLVALLAIVVGATVLSGLVTIYVDVPRQMGAEFRNYGANLIFLPAGGEASFTTQTTDEALSMIGEDALVGAAPYRYEITQIHEQPIETAGTDLEGARLTSPYWYVEGEWPDESGEMLVGRGKAELLALSAGDTVTMVFKSEDDPVDANGVVISPETQMTVTGILETGGSEEDYVYISMDDMEALCGDAGRLDVMELSVSAERDALEALAARIADASPGIAPRLVKRVTESEATVLTKLQALVLLVTTVVLVLTMICVATTMTAVVTERRREIGLKKALGASDRGVAAEFMGEGLFLGALGGIIGAALGFAFAQVVSMNVFSASITFQFWLVPLTMIASVLVTGLASVLPVRGATAVDPALVLKGE